MVSFEYASSNITCCSACGNILIRTGDTLAITQQLNAVTIKGYLLQPGTTGTWNGRTFKVLGRMGVWFEEAFYNYWFIVFNDDTTGFLAEGYGMYAILLPTQEPLITKDDLDNNRIGDQSASGYQLQKKSVTYYWEAEGELCLPGNSPYFEVFDYAAENGNLLTVFEWPDKPIAVYTDHPVTPGSLALKNTTTGDPYGITLKCRECATDIRVKTYPLSNSCTCGSCGTYYAIEKRSLVRKKANKRNHDDQLLAIGAKGELRGIRYEVIGYVEKEENNQYQSRWREYVLYNVQEGFAFLSEFDGHWIFVKETVECPVVLNEETESLTFNNEPFQLYNSYTYSIRDASGEFPYNIFDNNSTKVKEYISPPEMWIREKDAKEGIAWFFGQHITIGEIKSAFDMQGAAPYRQGIGAVQPVNYINTYKLAVLCIAGILGLLIIHWALMLNKENRTITEQVAYFNDSTNTVKITTEKFHLDKWRSNLTFEVFAPVNNSWFELSSSLVNTKTGTEYSMEKGVEYYYGYSDGENWTEGSKDATGYITNIPAGDYILTMEGLRETTYVSKLENFTVKVIYDAPGYRNFWYAALLFLIWPVVNYFRSNAKEKKRWENSPYAKFDTED